MNPEIKAEWLADLRSGDIPQTRGTLKNDEGMCCLGVLASGVIKRHSELLAEYAINIRELEGFMLIATQNYTTSNTLPSNFLDAVGISRYRGETITLDGEVNSLATLNDSGVDFEHIADIIEAEL